MDQRHVPLAASLSRCRLVLSHVAGRRRNLLICNPHGWSVLQSSLLAASLSRCSLVSSHVASRKRNLLICNPHSWSVLQSSLLTASSSRCRLVSNHVAGSREKTCRQQSWQPVPAAGNARRDAWPEVPVRVTTRLVHSVTACENYYLGATSAA
jgi:hypothetical protein